MFNWFKKKKIKPRQNIKDYEIQELRYSYRQMGKYIKRFNIPELEDIEARIENELRDIEVKKEWFAERFG